MKRKIINVLTGLLFLIGFGILVYPTVSNQWNTFRQSRLISSYEATMEPLTPGITMVAEAMTPTKNNRIMVMGVTAKLVSTS